MTRQIHVGPVPVGGGAPVSIQSMCSTKTDDVSATVDQILRLEEAGCGIHTGPDRVALTSRAPLRGCRQVRSAP